MVASVSPLAPRQLRAPWVRRSDCSAGAGDQSGGLHSPQHPPIATLPYTLIKPPSTLNPYNHTLPSNPLITTLPYTPITTLNPLVLLVPLVPHPNPKCEKETLNENFGWEKDHKSFAYLPLMKVGENSTTIPFNI